MIKQTLIAAFGLCFTPAPAQKPANTELITEFDKILRAEFKTDQPGATVLVAKKGEILYKQAFGMANLELEKAMQSDNVFRIGSITKQFTAVAILQLMEKGELRLQDDIKKFIPDYPTQGNRITIEHLLTHTSGIQNYSSMKEHTTRSALDVTPAEMIDLFKNEPMKFAPGTNWSYSNSNYFLLGYIIEKISGKTYAEYLEENIFKPAGMKNSYYAGQSKVIKYRASGYSKSGKEIENAGYLSMTQPYAAGSILSTVEDLNQWNLALHTYKLVKKETLDKALTKYKLADGRETDYGYGWRLGHVYDSPSIWHGGLISGFMTMEVYLPEEEVFVAVFTNCDCYAIELLSFRLAALAAGKPYGYKETAIEYADLNEYTGVYENAKGRQRIITAYDKKLHSQISRGPQAQLKAYEKDKFFIDDIVSLEFSRNKKGEIETVTSKHPTGNDVWIRTNKPVPDAEGIKVDPKTLDAYVGQYSISPEFSFSITKEQDRLFLQAPEQGKLEMFAETPTRFFLKVNDAQFEFIKDPSGKVIKAILSQGGKQAEAKKAN